MMQKTLRVIEDFNPKNLIKFCIHFLFFILATECTKAHTFVQD